MTTRPTQRARTVAGGLALLSAPGVLLVAGLIHPAESDDAGRQLQIVASHSPRWFAAHALFALGFALFVPAALALGRRLRDAAPRAELVGTGLAVMGSIAMVGFMALEGFGTWQLAQVGGPAAAQVLDRLTHSGAVAMFAVTGLALQAGLIVVAAGLGRTRAARTWAAWTLGVSALVLGTGFAAQADPLLIAGNVGIVVALAALGLEDVRTRSGPTVRGTFAVGGARVDEQGRSSGAPVRVGR